MSLKTALYYLICKFTQHKLGFAGECPYTGSTYDYCKRCSSMIPRDKAV